MTGLPDIDPEQAADVMRASGGHICYRHTGIGRGWEMRWNAARNGYEYLVTANDPQPAPEDSEADILVGIEVKEYVITTRDEIVAMLEEMLEEYDSMDVGLSDLLKPVEYEETNFLAAHRLAEGPQEYRTGQEDEERQHPDQATLRITITD